MLSKVQKRKNVRLRIRTKISGTAARPRLSIFKSNKAIYCQLIDDVNSVTLAAASSRELSTKGTPIEVAKEVGKLLGNKAKENDISIVVFDRGGYIYHGRVKAVAEGAREEGLKF